MNETMHAQSPVFVRGKLIQIYTARDNGPVYPNGQRSGSDDFFDDNIPDEIDGKEFATSVPEEGMGPMQISGDIGRYVIAAVHHTNVDIPGWTDLNITFTRPDSIFYFKNKINFVGGVWDNLLEN